MKKSALILLTLGWICSIALGANTSWSAEYCGILKGFTGSLQVFDSSRTQVLNVLSGQKLSCGSWLSVEEGITEVEHQGGGSVQIGANSFVQILAPKGNLEKNHFTLYRGQMVIQVSQAELIRVLTANAKVIITGASPKSTIAYLLYSTEQQETQLLGVQTETKKNIQIQNRFLDPFRISLGVAEYSVMGEKSERNIPTQSKLVSKKTVSQRLAKMGVSGNLVTGMVNEVEKKSQLRMPASIQPLNPVAEMPSSSIDRPQSSKKQSSKKLVHRAPATQVQSRKPAAIQSQLAQPVSQPDLWESFSKSNNKEKEKLLKELSEMKKSD